MKVKQTNDKECPICGKWDMVMAMSTGTIRVYGCLRCRNAQGAHRTIKEAKAAWKIYCAKQEKPK